MRVSRYLDIFRSKTSYLLAVLSLSKRLCLSVCLASYHLLPLLFSTLLIDRADGNSVDHIFAIFTAARH